METDQIWTSVQEELSFQLAKPTYDTWVKRTKLLREQGGCYQIGVPSKLAKDWLEDRFSSLIQETLQAVLGGGEVELDFVVVPGHAHLPPAGPVGITTDQIPGAGRPTVTPAEGPRRPSGQELLDSGLNERFQFSNFVVGNNSRFAHAAARAVAEAPGETYNPLFLYGGVGLGKTHLVHAVGNHALKQNRDCHVVYLSSEAFTNDLIHALEQH
ncbi:MAG: DnaA ATPase domain-containing protein, partial [Candidatus Dormibacteraceae bacterium]